MNFPHCRSFIRAAVPEPPETLEKGAKGGALLSFSCKRYMPGIKIAIPRRGNKMLFIFLLAAASAQTTFL